MPLSRSIVVTLLLFMICPSLHAQEIHATVQVDRSQVNNTSLDYLDNFANEVQSYVNDNTWTNDNFQSQEQINVNIQITLLRANDNFTFDAAIIIRSMRPVYGSTQQTTVFLYNDENWTFTYTPNRGFVHDKLQFDAFTTLLDFYSYVIIGFDYDTFSPLGGSPYFSEAQNFVSLAQSNSSTGWERSTSVPRNRAQLMADVVNPNYEALRQASYIYHRKGLDLFLDDPQTARQNIIKALKMIRDAKRQTTSNLLADTFFNAKSREIASIFKDAPTDLRLQAYNILSDVDQAHLNDYSELQ